MNKTKKITTWVLLLNKNLCISVTCNHNTAQIILEYGFCLTRIFSYMDRLVDSVIIWETG